MLKTLRCLVFFILLLMVAKTGLAAESKDLLGNTTVWKGSNWAPTDKGPLVQSISVDTSVLPDNKKVLRIDIINDGDGKTNYPSIIRTFDPPEDWTKFRFIQVRLMVKSDNPEVKYKTACFVIQNQPAAGEKVVQQFPEKQFVNVPVGQWVEYKSSIEYVERDKVQDLFPHFYEIGWLLGEGGGALNKFEHITWYISELKLSSE